MWATCIDQNSFAVTLLLLALALASTHHRHPSNPSVGTCTGASSTSTMYAPSQIRLLCAREADTNENPIIGSTTLSPRQYECWGANRANLTLQSPTYGTLNWTFPRTVTPANCELGPGETFNVERKFTPTYTQRIIPTANNILLAFDGEGQQQQGWSRNTPTIVATGPSVGNFKEGDQVAIDFSKCSVNLVAPNTRTSDLTAAPYCILKETDILGLVETKTNGANRADVNVMSSGIVQSNPVGVHNNPHGVFQGN
eukprot:NODE_1926_length_1033_cov_136.621951_g1567_i0.p1 GENE.NODE_1926_length_1033_cov_136.621951_g1567_i0~~NODE_1926_length_1033_cov_136.621951_g1567_i0.p1  ORF type:complete len:255 (+),score=40.57 NODE_1926_length_1033_cov_136.621951_g1567_i0:120-884(+)